MKETAISADGLPIRYEVRGAGGPALVFVHGWCCNRSYWIHQLEHFSKQYASVAVDLGGHGESGIDRRQWTIPMFGEDVAAVVRRLGLERAVLIGHSMGGPVIVEAALRLRSGVVGLVGVDTFRDLDQTLSKKQIDEMLAPFRADFAQAAGRFVRSTMFVPSSEPGLIEKIVAAMTSAPPVVGIGAAEGLLGHSETLREGLRRLASPVIAINSDYRPNDANVFRKHGIELETVSGVGHFVMMEDPARFNRLLEKAIGRFLRAVQTAK